MSTTPPGLRGTTPLHDTTPTNDIGFLGRMGAGMGMVGAGIEMGLGVAACYTGVGCVVGGPAVLHGFDNFQSNFRTLWTGTQVDSMTVQGLEAMGVPGAEYINAGVGIVLSGGAGTLANSAKVGSIAANTAVTGSEAAGKGFFEGTRYSQKVLQQMRRGAGEFHSFPESVAGFEKAGAVRTITGGDRVVRQALEIPGSYGGHNGVFQFIKEADGIINHRLFVPNP